MENKKLMWLIIGVVALVVIMACVIPVMTVKSVSSQTYVEYHVENLSTSEKITGSYTTYKPSAGNQYLIVKLSFKNVDKNMHYVSMGNMTVVVNGIGYSIDYSATTAFCEIRSNTEYNCNLASNGKCTLYGVYQVPIGTTQCKIVPAYSYLCYKEV